MSVHFDRLTFSRDASVPRESSAPHDRLVLAVMLLAAGILGGLILGGLLTIAVGPLPAWAWAAVLTGESTLALFIAGALLPPGRE